MAKILLFEVKTKCPPDNILRKVPRRPKNSDVRSREHLTLDEVNTLMKTAGSIGRHQHRDRTLILTMFRHGLRVSEAIDLKWDQVNFKAGSIHINRLKNGKPATHFLEGDEMRALRRLRREQTRNPFIFVTERGGPLTRSTVNKMIERAGYTSRILRFRYTHTCCAMPVGIIWPTREWIPEPSKTTWDMFQSPTPCVTQNFHRINSKVSGLRTHVIPYWS